MASLLPSWLIVVGTLSDCLTFVDSVSNISKAASSEVNLTYFLKDFASLCPVIFIIIWLS